MKCRESLVLFAFLLVFSFTAFGRRASLNTFAVNKVYTSASNTVVCVPWSGYATNEPPPLAINKLVNSLNLNVDDMLLACTNESTKYDAWQYVKDDKGQPFWKQVNVVERYNPGGLDSFGVTNGLRRGTGLWVVRKSHVAADAIPLYLHGQYATNEASVVVASGTTNNPSAVLLADMDYTKRMNVNDMVDWRAVGIGGNDRLSIPSETGAMEATRDLSWNGTFWYYRKKVREVVNNIGRWKYENVTNGVETSVAPGTGFWFMRRTEGGEPDTVTVTFRKPSFANPPAGQN